MIEQDKCPGFKIEYQLIPQLKFPQTLYINSLFWLPQDIFEHAVSEIGDALNSCKTVDKDEQFQIFPREFGSSSSDIEVAWWTDPKPLDVRRSRAEVVTAVKKFLDEAAEDIENETTRFIYNVSIIFYRQEDLDSLPLISMV